MTEMSTAGATFAEEGVCPEMDVACALGDAGLAAVEAGLAEADADGSWLNIPENAH
jgi:hypothetical protein